MYYGESSYEKKKTKKSEIDVPLFLMLLPGMIYLIINNYLPMYGITIAFKNLDYSKGIWGSPWVGLKNFEYLFKTKDAAIMIRNTLCYNLVFIFGGLVLALAIAVMMTETGQTKIAKFISSRRFAFQTWYRSSLCLILFMHFWVQTAL